MTRNEADNGDPDFRLEPAPDCIGGRAATVYFDGSCPLCSAEIRHYKSRKGGERLKIVDVSGTDANLGPGLTKHDAMTRFHVRLPDDRLLSGARAFVAVWNILPAWRWAARLAALPGATMTLEGLYRAFLPIRPVISHLAWRFKGQSR